MGESYIRDHSKVERYILAVLRALGGSADRQAIKEQIVSDERIPLTHEDVFVPVYSKKSGNPYVPFNYDFNFGLKNLCNSGHIEEYGRGGDIVLTEKGRSVNIDQYPTEEDEEKQGAYWAKKHEERQQKKAAQGGTDIQSQPIDEVAEEDEGPDSEQWKVEILERIKQFSPKKFESFSRLLFSKMGVKFDAEKGVKMSGDHGMDGYGYFVSDEFRTSKVVVQCKRFSESAVGEPAINELMGVMMAESADYGIFVTTSYFTKQAQRKAVQGSCTVTLIDGQKLVELIERYQLHIKPVTTYELDDYYYEQD